MDTRVGDATIHRVEHGRGRPVVVLHGAGVDHREAEACFEPALDVNGLRRIYPDLPGMGRSTAPASVASADDVLDVPAHAPLFIDDGLADDDLGDAGFRDYFVLQTAEMLARYERFVAPAADLVDAAAMERIGQRWELVAPAGDSDAGPYAGPVLLVAGRQDATVGWAATVDLAEVYPGATLAVLDGAGHALPHEQPALLAALVGDLLRRAATARSGGPLGR